jgi:hypothetical protein
MATQNKCTVLRYNIIIFYSLFCRQIANLLPRKSSSMIVLISTTLLGLTMVLAVRTWWVLQSLRKEENRSRMMTTMMMTPSLSSPRIRRSKPLKTLVVLGSGGHTTEMLHLLKHLNTADHYTPISYVVATTDTTSLRRVEAFGGRIRPDHIYKIPRSREVGQSYLSSVVTTLYSFVHAIVLVVWIRPGLVLSNGPGTCLPIVISTLACRILGICEGRNVFVESFCRVTRYVLCYVMRVGVFDIVCVDVFSKNVNAVFDAVFP